MIDTDKYEGHTPGPWTNEYDEELGEHTIESHDGMIAQRVLGVDADLIAAAPDLLAEVERLRGIIDYIRDIGRLAKQKKGLPSSFLSIMEKVLTTEEYLEWRNEE